MSVIVLYTWENARLSRYLSVFYDFREYSTNKMRNEFDYNNHELKTKNDHLIALHERFRHDIILCYINFHSTVFDLATNKIISQLY